MRLSLLDSSGLVGFIHLCPSFGPCLFVGRPCMKGSNGSGQWQVLRVLQKILKARAISSEDVMHCLHLQVVTHRLRPLSLEAERWDVFDMVYLCSEG